MTDPISSILVAWGVSQATSVFVKVLQKLAEEVLKDTFKDYIKEFFKGSINKLRNLGQNDPLKVAFGQALNQFLELVQLGLEDAGIDEEKELEQYNDSLYRLVTDPSVLQALGEPFLIAIANTSLNQEKSLPEILSQTWNDLSLKPLPDEFDWEKLAERYSKKVNLILRKSEDLKKLLEDSIPSVTAPTTEFDFGLYQKKLKTSYGNLNLDTLGTSGWSHSLKLWNMFVVQNISEWHEDNNQGTLSNAPKDILDILNDRQDNYKYVVILGDPGTGKSTLVRYKALEWARKSRNSLSLLELPLLIELNNYIRSRKAGSSHIFQEYFHQASGLKGGNLDKDKLHNWLKTRDSLVMFDGLDEVLDEGDREQVVTDIVNFTIDYPKARVLVTSRIVGYKSQFLRNAEFKHFRLEPLNEEQIRKFINQWHKLAFENKDKADGERKRDRLLKAIEVETFKELAGNPLLLTMMAILNRRDDLPRDRATLYRDASEVLLQRWDAAKNLPNDETDYRIKTIDDKDKQEMLRQIAYNMRTKASNQSGKLLIGEEALQDIIAKTLEKIGFSESKIVAKYLMAPLTSRSFILCFMGGDLYGFVHRTFQEYFCAWYYVNLFEKDKSLPIHEIKTKFCNNCKYEAWHEVLKLIIGMIDERSAAEILEELIKTASLKDSFINLFFAVECFEYLRKPLLFEATADKLIKQLRYLRQGQIGVDDTIRNEAVVATDKLDRLFQRLKDEQAELTEAARKVLDPTVE